MLIFIKTPAHQYNILPPVVYQEHEFDYVITLEAEDFQKIRTATNENITWIIDTDPEYSENTAIKTARVKDRLVNKLPLDKGLYLIRIYFKSTNDLTEMYMNFDSYINQIYLQKKEKNNLSVQEHYVFLEKPTSQISIFLDSENTTLILDKFEVLKSKFEFRNYPPQEDYLYSCVEDEDCEAFPTHCCASTTEFLPVNRNYIQVFFMMRGSCDNVSCRPGGANKPPGELKCNNKKCQFVFTRKYNIKYN